MCRKPERFVCVFSSLESMSLGNVGKHKQTRISLGAIIVLIKHTYIISVNGEWRYFRSCAYVGEPGIEGDERFCLMRTGTYNIWMEYCTCNTKDGCNTGSLSTLSSIAGFVSFITVLFR